MLSVLPTRYEPRPATVPAYPRPANGFGQGKCAATILADQADLVPVITDQSYQERQPSRAPRYSGRGQRYMHRTTLNLATQLASDYTTTVKQNFGGSRTLPSGEQREPFPSAHISQLKLGPNPHIKPWRSHYTYQFPYKGVPASEDLRLPAFNNQMSQTEGLGMKRVMSAPADQVAPAPHWTQYHRVHNTLGVILGPGVPHHKPPRKEFNPLTGEHIGAAWQDDNKRISGNRVLYQGHRKEAQDNFVLG